MEIKLRRKGEIVTVDGFPANRIPSEILLPEGFEGIDLTAYSVIYAGFGRHGHDKAKELHSRAPGAIVVYKYEWRNGWGEGILLPENFNPSRIRFYKSAEQIEAERKAKKEEELRTLKAEVEQEFPDLRVLVMADYYAEECRGVEFYPAQQETYNVCSPPFHLTAKSLQEAKSLVEQYRPVWREWNDRALQAYAAHGFYNPGNGSIKVVIRHKKAAVTFNQRDDVSGKYNGGWIMFEERDGEWVETDVQSGDPLNSKPYGF